MLKKIAQLLFFFIFIGSIISCGEFNKISKSTDLKAKYAAADDYYAKKDYYHAQILYEDLIVYYRGSEHAEKISYYNAMCHYNLGDYETASYYLKLFYKSFPKSKYVSEAQFLSAYCMYLESPSYSLDQTNSITAIKELQLFVNTNPKSDSIATCNKLIDDLRAKLEIKEFEISKLYYKTENYKAAIVAFENTVKNYPNSVFKEECLYYILKANYLYANYSISSKKMSRFQSAVEAYDNLISEYPQSKYLKEAENINKTALKEINKINNTKS